jgi:hypothetical protein
MLRSLLPFSRGFEPAISCIFKLFVKSENVLCVVVIGKSHDDAVGKTDGLGKVFELFKCCLDMRGRLDENELITG